MRTLRIAAMFAVTALLLISAQVGRATMPPSTVKVIGQPVWALGMDWPRVAYASGEENYRESMHVWNVATGATSAIDGGSHGFAVHRTSEIAMRGKHVFWVRSQQFGNTELRRWLYTAPVGGSAHLLKWVYGYTDMVCGLGGPQLGGLAGSGKAVVVSRWNAGNDGSVVSHQRLSLVTLTGLRTIATGPDAIVSQSTNGGHIAVLPLPTVSVTPEGCSGATQPTSVFVYATTGALLATIPLPAADPSTLGYQLAIRGARLVVLTYGLHEPSGPAWVTLTVYNWTTGALLHTWPVGIGLYPGEVNFSFYGHVAAVEGALRLHLVSLDTGKDVTIAQASRTECPTALGPYGLVYAVNPNDVGKLVFVPMARLLKLVS